MQNIYNCLQVDVKNPHSNFIKLAILCKTRLTEFNCFWTWILKFNFQFKKISKYLIHSCDCNVVSFDNFMMSIDKFLDFSKWINSDFKSSNLIIFDFSQSNIDWIGNRFATKKSSRRNTVESSNRLITSKLHNQ